MDSDFLRDWLNCAILPLARPGGTVSGESGFCKTLQQHDHWTLLLGLAGVCKFHGSGGVLTLAPGSACLLPPSTPARLSAEQSMTYYVVCFNIVALQGRDPLARLPLPAVVPLRVLNRAGASRTETAEQRAERIEALWRRRRLFDDRSLALHPPKRRRRPVLWLVELVLEPGRLRRALARLFKQVSDLLLAHSRGLVTGETARRRWAACVRCTYRRRKAITPGGRPVSYASAMPSPVTSTPSDKLAFS